MKIPRFWSRANHEGTVGLGWSDVSQSEADERARIRAEQNADLVARGELREHPHDYYPDRPLREPILQELFGPDGAATGLVTRNSYGALVLNTVEMLFVDVDLPAPKPVPVEDKRTLLQKLFGAPKEPDIIPEVALTPALTRAARWAEANDGWSWRVYRTRAGLRFLAEHAPIPSGDPVVAQVFEAMGADPLYRQLCRSQECYRARLTPKPWRAGFRRPGVRWPFQNEQTRTAFDRWDAEYVAHCRGFSTCERLAGIGTSKTHPDLRSLIELHDTATRVGSGLPLA